MVMIEMRPWSLIITDLIAGLPFFFLLMPITMKGIKSNSSTYVFHFWLNRIDFFNMSEKVYQYVS